MSCWQIVFRCERSSDIRLPKVFLKFHQSLLACGRHKENQKEQQEHPKVGCGNNAALREQKRPGLFIKLPIKLTTLRCERCAAPACRKPRPAPEKNTWGSVRKHPLHKNTTPQHDEGMWKKRENRLNKTEHDGVCGDLFYVPLFLPSRSTETPTLSCA